MAEKNKNAKKYLLAFVVLVVLIGYAWAQYCIRTEKEFVNSLVVYNNQVIYVMNDNSFDWEDTEIVLIGTDIGDCKPVAVGTVKAGDKATLYPSQFVNSKGETMVLPQNRLEQAVIKTKQGTAYKSF